MDTIQPRCWQCSKLLIRSISREQGRMYERCPEGHVTRSYPYVAYSTGAAR